MKQKKDSQKLKLFLSSLDEVELEKKDIFIPELPLTVPEKLPEEKFFGKDLKKSIVIRKHPNFTPEFMHSHEFLEFFYVLEGQSRQVINEKDFHMEQGDLCCIPPNTRHSLNVFDGSIILNILIRQTTFQKLFHNFLCTDSIISSFIIENMYSSKASDYIIFHTKNNQLIRDTIMRMFDENKKNDVYAQDMLMILLNFLFIELMRNCNDSYDLPLNVNKNNLIRFDIIKAIHKDYETITLEKLSESFRMTPQYTSRYIKQLTGKNFSQILFEIRMNKACSLLKETLMPVGDIANQIGYENPEHFVRYFKKKYSMTPGEFRSREI